MVIALQNYANECPCTVSEWLLMIIEYAAEVINKYPVLEIDYNKCPFW